GRAEPTHAHYGRTIYGAGGRGSAVTICRPAEGRTLQDLRRAAERAEAAQSRIRFRTQSRIRFRTDDRGAAWRAVQGYRWRCKAAGGARVSGSAARSQRPPRTGADAQGGHSGERSRGSGDAALEAGNTRIRGRRRN